VAVSIVTVNMRRRFLLLVLFTAAVASLPGASAAATIGVRQRAAVPYDLAADEKLGGHTLARHVGRSDADLAERLQRERNISAASTYPDQATAARVVGAAIAQSKAKLDAWTARRGPRPNLVLRYEQATGPPIGRSLARGARSPQPCHRALVVIRWDERRQRWFVLTSYPEAAR
jgi:hypothetical protein